MLTAIFSYLAAASVASALLAVTRKNPVHSILWVLSLFLHVAGIFLLLGAEFVAAVQVIVYAGAILIFYLFVLMLLDLSDEESRPRFGNHWPFAVAVGLSFATLAWLAQIETIDPVGVNVAPAAASMEAETPLGSLSDIGMALFGPFALPFEIGLTLNKRCTAARFVAHQSRPRSQPKKSEDIK